MDKNNMPEAPASVTYSITTPGGFNALFTVRDTSGTELINKMKIIESSLIVQGYKPQERKAWGGGAKVEKPIVYVENEACPVCGSKLIEAETSKGKIIKCSTQKYDFKTKTSSGCAYMRWVN